MRRVNSRIQSDGVEIAIGKTISRLRRQRGVGQEAFAVLANINRTYITDIELGRRSIGVGVLVKIVTALNMTLYEFVSAMNEERIRLNHKTL